MQGVPKVYARFTQSEPKLDFQLLIKGKLHSVLCP